MAHRVSYALLVGDPGFALVLHACDNPSCVNPAHLFLGTQAENMKDMDSKGRRGIWHPRGDLNGRAKLSVSQVRQIREMYNTTRASKQRIAEAFGVSDVLVGRIVSRRAWSHV